MRDDGRRTTDDRRRIIVVIILALASASTLLSGCAAPVVTAALAKVETGVDAAAWAKIPAGAFVLGQHEEKGSIEKPYEIMVTDVTNARYARYLTEALAQGTVKVQDDQVVGYYPGDPYHGYKHEKEIAAGDWLHVPLKDPSVRLSFDGKTFGVKPGYEDHPMTLVTWFGAQAFCEFYGWRLPAEVEWEKAARGADNRPFPWGYDIARNYANFYASRDPFERLAGKQGDTTPVGFYNGQSQDGYQTADSRSPYGLYDMAGNVWQWTADLQEGIHDRWLRGGSKDNYEYNLRIWEHNSARPDYASPSVGFRCAR
jgi:formylglycine-generating enzyme